MRTHIPDNFTDMVEPMQQANEKILARLQTYGLTYEAYPTLNDQGYLEGVAAAKAYPIQGILKYHGLSDWDWRIAYLPSISFNNDAAHTLTLVELDQTLDADLVTINGVEAVGRDLRRVEQMLNVLREIAKVQTRARVISENVVRATKTGKGLGTSASASAALAAAATSALFGPDIVKNTRFLTCISRLLAGSGCRSAAGGIALWLSYPGIAHENSFAIRLDQQNQLRDMRLITIPLDSRIGLQTELAHEDAPNSPFYKTWMHNRLAETLDCLTAIQAGDWQTVAQFAEHDSIQLHGVTMSGSRKNKIFAWEPENIVLFRLCNDLRSDGVPVYFSTDTGPTVVLMTHKDSVESVTAKIQAAAPSFELIHGQVAGPVEMVDVEWAKEMLL